MDKDDFDFWRKRISLEILQTKLLSKRADNIMKEDLNKQEIILQKYTYELKRSGLRFTDTKYMFKDLYKRVRETKRRIENHKKMEHSDYAAFMEKYQSDNKPLLPIFDIPYMNGAAATRRRIDPDQMKETSFDPLEFTNRELCTLVLDAFKSLDLLRVAKLPESQLASFIAALCLDYNVVPYHNFSHAISVYQIVFALYCQEEIKQYIDEFTLFSGLIAALGHDLNHKGVNNTYHLKKRSPIAIQYSDEAILENHHASRLFEFLSDPKHDVTIGMVTKDKQTFRRLVLTNVLATDMSKHFRLTEKFGKKVTWTKQYNEMLAKNEEPHDLIKEHTFLLDRIEDQRFMINVLIHAADLGNPCLHYPIYMKWAKLVTQEFHDQTVKEQNKGLEVTAMLKFKDIPTFYGNQIFFSSKVVLPLWEHIANLLPRAQAFVDNIKTNVRALETVKESESKKSNGHGSPAK